MSDRSLLEQLCVAEPWPTSREGMDDECLFCGSYDRRYVPRDGEEYASIYRYRHENGCIWMTVMDYLGRPHPEHTFLPIDVTASTPDATLVVSDR